MYYELLILARLMYGPQHGYLIAKVTSDMLGPWTKVSPGSLYPILAQLVRTGLIHEVGPAPASRRDPRSYAITDAGRARFRELMLDTTTNPSDYQRRFHLKVPSLEFLAAHEHQALFDHYDEYCRTAIRYLEKEARLLVQYGPDSGATTAAGIAAAVDLMTHQMSQWQAELAWVGRLRAHVATLGQGELGGEHVKESAESDGAIRVGWWRQSVATVASTTSGIAPPFSESPD